MMMVLMVRSLAPLLIELETATALAAFLSLFFCDIHAAWRLFLYPKVFLACLGDCGYFFVFVFAAFDLFDSRSDLTWHY